MIVLGESSFRGDVEGEGDMEFELSEFSDEEINATKAEIYRESQDMQLSPVRGEPSKMKVKFSFRSLLWYYLFECILIYMVLWYVFSLLKTVAFMFEVLLV